MFQARHPIASILHDQISARTVYHRPCIRGGKCSKETAFASSISVQQQQHFVESSTVSRCGGKLEYCCGEFKINLEKKHRMVF